MASSTVSDPLRISEFRTNFKQSGNEQNPESIIFQLNSETPDANQIVTALASFSAQYAQNQTIRNYVEALLPTDIAPNDQKTQYDVVASFVLTKLVYVADPNGIEYIISPLRHLWNICNHGVSYGDCDDHVLLFNSMLGSIGFETHVVGVKSDPSNTYFDHVLSMVNLGGTQYFFDACNKTNPYAEPAGSLLIL
jgi:hypothetical protein